jgi:hypothetical protein
MQILAVVGAVFAYKTAEVGGGRHVWDPIQTPANLERYLRNMWFGQLFNLYGMALVKLSICTYILKLDFTKGYRVIIWMSIVIHLGVNFVFPSVILLGECAPISKHWDVAGTQSGSCWGSKPRVISGKTTTLSHRRQRLTHTNRILGSSNKHPHRSDLHRLATCLYISGATSQPYIVGCSCGVPAWAHVSSLS